MQIVIHISKAKKTRLFCIQASTVVYEYSLHLYVRNCIHAPMYKVAIIYSLYIIIVFILIFKMLVFDLWYLY